MGPMIGAFGSGGVCLCIAVWIVLGSRKKEKGKLAQKFKPEHTAWWMIVFGIFSATAGQAFSAPSQVGEAFNHALTTQAAFGNVGVAAAALLLTLFLFGIKPNVWKDAILGATLPSVYTAAGGIWALPITVVTSVLKGFVS